MNLTHRHLRPVPQKRKSKKCKRASIHADLRDWESKTGTNIRGGVWRGQITDGDIWSRIDWKWKIKNKRLRYISTLNYQRLYTECRRGIPSGVPRGSPPRCQRRLKVTKAQRKEKLRGFESSRQSGLPAVGRSGKKSGKRRTK